MTRNEYYHCKLVYEGRRDKLRVTISQNLKVLRNLSYKINAYQKSISKIDRRNKKIHALLVMVNDYFNVDIKSSSMNLKHILARQIFFKIGMENNMRGVDLSQFIGRHKRSAFKNRILLTKNFATNSEKRETFYAFKKYLDSLDTNKKLSNIHEKTNPIPNDNDEQKTIFIRPIAQYSNKGYGYLTQ